MTVSVLYYNKLGWRPALLAERDAMYEFEMIAGEGLRSVWDVISYGMKIAEITVCGKGIVIAEKEWGFADTDEIPEIEEAFYRNVIRRLK